MAKCRAWVHYSTIYQVWRTERYNETLVDQQQETYSVIEPLKTTKLFYQMSSILSNGGHKENRINDTPNVTLGTKLDLTLRDI